MYFSFEKKNPSKFILKKIGQNLDFTNQKNNLNEIIFIEKNNSQEVSGRYFF